jgi:hypothetical protein
MSTKSASGRSRPTVAKAALISLVVLALRTPSRGVLAHRIDRGNGVALYQRDNFIAMGMKKAVAAH